MSAVLAARLQRGHRFSNDCRQCAGMWVSFASIMVLCLAAKALVSGIDKAGK
jgi:hypothetical protein